METLTRLIESVLDVDLDVKLQGPKMLSFRFIQDNMGGKHRKIKQIDSTHWKYPESMPYRGSEDPRNAYFQNNFIMLLWDDAKREIGGKNKVSLSKLHQLKTDYDVCAIHMYYGPERAYPMYVRVDSPNGRECMEFRCAEDGTELEIVSNPTPPTANIRKKDIFAVADFYYQMFKDTIFKGS